VWGNLVRADFHRDFDEGENMKKLLTVALLALSLAASGGSVFGQDDKDKDKDKSLTYTNVIKIRKDKGARGGLAPIARIVSPLADSQIAPGEGRIGAGSPNGAGFALNIEVVTRDSTPITARESLNIRNTALLGEVNPNIPGL